MRITSGCRDFNTMCLGFLLISILYAFSVAAVTSFSQNKEYNIFQIKSVISGGQKPKAAPLAETKVCRVSWKGSFLVWSLLASGVHLYSLDYSIFLYFLSILLLLLLAGLPINSSNSVSLFSEASGDDKGSIWIGSPLHLKILDPVSSTSLSHNMTFIGLQNQDMEYLGGYFIAHDIKII